MTSGQAISKLKHDKKYSQEIIELLEKEHKDFEWLKHKLNLTFLNSLSTPEDKMKVMEIMGYKYEEELL